jgi:hypothetical protein
METRYEVAESPTPTSGGKVQDMATAVLDDEEAYSSRSDAVVSDTMNPSFESSAWIRGAPQPS